MASNVEVMYAGVVACSVAGIAVRYGNDVRCHALVIQKRERGFGTPPAALEICTAITRRYLR
jgi:hypothetical protein